MVIISGPNDKTGQTPAADNQTPEPLVGSTRPDDGAAATGAAMLAGGDPVKDATSESFAADVIDASMHTPVIVDFWAPWCKPCKILGPMLEKHVRQSGGMVRMVKINVDENQDLASQMHVQSIPVVYAFSQGKPVDGFQGAVPESKIREMISKLTGGAKSPIDQALDVARAALDSGAVDQAMQIYSEILGADDGNASALAGLIRCSVATGDTDMGREIFNGMTPELQKNADIMAAMAALELAEQAGGGDEDMLALCAAVEQKPADHQARFDLAMAFYGQAKNDEAIEALVEIISRDRTWNEEAAREQLLKIFEALGHTHPSTIEGRRKLSAVLFS